MVWLAAAAFVAAGVGSGALRNNAKRTAANADLQAAYDNAELFEEKSRQVISVTRFEGAQLFREQGMIQSQRVGRQVARGIASSSHAVQAMNRSDSYEVQQDYRNLVANAYMEASQYRTQGRLQVQRAQRQLDIAEDQRETDILLGALGGASSAMSLFAGGSE